MERIVKVILTICDIGIIITEVARCFYLLFMIQESTISCNLLRSDGLNIDLMTEAGRTAKSFVTGASSHDTGLSETNQPGTRGYVEVIHILLLRQPPFEDSYLYILVHPRI